MDVWCLKETLIDDCYERYGYTIQPDWTVIDVGAGIGDFTVLAATKAQRGTVHAFEPYPESFALLKDNLSLNRVPMAMPHQLAVTGQPGHLQLDTTAGEPLMIQSVAAEDQPEAAPETIASITLEEIAQSYSLLVIDLLKLDCEGAEYDILYHSPPSTLARVQRIVMEYHEQSPPKTHQDLVPFLEAAGFMVETFPSPVHPHLIGYLRASREA
jgi:FkbM family methyltransferase